MVLFVNTKRLLRSTSKKSRTRGLQSLSYVDITCQKFGRLTAISYVGSGKWLCKCDCGNEKVVRSCHLREGHTRSCGCLSRKSNGMSGTRIYNVWCGMIGRCYVESNSIYDYYGGRGIQVCDEWRDFNKFYLWAVDHGWSEDSYDLSLDRVDPDGDYCPENCRWVDKLTQANNKRNTSYITVRGETRSVSEWARYVGISYRTIRSRLVYGWNEEDAIFTPVKACVKYKDR